MGFATVFKTVDWLAALAAGGATLLLTAVALFMALYMRDTNFQFSIALFSALCGSTLAGLISYIIEYVSGSTKQIAQKISVGVSFILAMVLAIFLTMNRLRFCITYKDVYCTIIFRAFLLWLEMLIMFTAVYAPFEKSEEACSNALMFSLRL
nr:unnamed protein product [Trichobilharzia regenti]